MDRDSKFTAGNHDDRRDSSTLNNPNQRHEGIDRVLDRLLERNQARNMENRRDRQDLAKPVRVIRRVPNGTIHRPPTSEVNR